MDVTVEGERAVDPATGRTLYFDMEVSTGTVIAGAICEFDGDTLHYTSKPGGETRTSVLDPDVLTGDSFDFSYLTHLQPGDEPVTKLLLDALRGNVHTKRFAPADVDTLIAGGVSYACLVFDTYNETAGVTTRMWIDRQTGRLIRDLSADGSSITADDATVRARVRRADIDDMILAKVNVEIDDIRAITSMKVKAKVRTVGQPVTPETLNVRGQRFDGTVERNYVEGVFEVQHTKYDGTNPPPFPPQVDEALSNSPNRNSKTLRWSRRRESKPVPPSPDAFLFDHLRELRVECTRSADTRLGPS